MHESESSSFLKPCFSNHSKSMPLPLVASMRSSDGWQLPGPLDPAAAGQFSFSTPYDGELI